MTTHAVTVVLLDGEGSPLHRRAVRANLVGWVADEYVAVGGFTGGGIVVAPVESFTGPDGSAVFDLVDNADISPANTYWRVTAAGRAWVIEVTGDGTVEDLLVDTPTAYADIPLAAHAADTTAVHGIADTALLETAAGAQAKADAAQAAAEATAADADNLTSGTVADARIPATIARDTELDALLAQHVALENPHGTELDDLTDVDAAAPSGGAALAWSGTAWVPTDMGTQIELDAEAAAREAADVAVAADAADALSAHAADTTSVHGIADTALLETAAGAQAKADAAQSAAEATAADADNLTSGTVADARIPATIARDTEVTAAVDAEATARAADVAAEEAARIAAVAAEVTAREAGDDGLADALAAHEVDTTNVHGIVDTSALETTTGAQAKVDAEAAAREAGDAALASDLASEAALARNADNLTSGTVADARIPATIARDTEVTTAISTHAAVTTAVHGIADTALLETVAGAQAKVDLSVPKASLGSLWIPAQLIVPYTPGGAERTSNGGGLSYDQAAVEGASTVFRTPSWWLTARPEPVWYNPSVVTGSVEWWTKLTLAGAGESLVGASFYAGYNTGFTHTYASVSANTGLLTQDPLWPVFTCDPSKFCYLQVERNGSSGLDSLASDAVLVGVVVTQVT